MDDGEAKKKQI